MFSLFSHTKKNNRSIILDIQSGLVRGALVRENDDGTCSIEAVVTKALSGKNHIVNSTFLTKCILKLVVEAVEHLSLESGSNRIWNVHYILSSPWITTKLKTVVVNYKDETEVTTATLADIVKNELKKSEEGDSQPIDQKIFEIKLNGYSTAAFDYKKTKALEVSMATTFSSKSFLTKLHASVQEVIDIPKNTHNSALLLQYAALRDIFSEKGEYIYIHVHSELTDIIIVKNGLCRHIASFPFGIMNLLRKIASSTHQSIESSDSLLSLYQGDKLNESEKEATQRTSNPLLREWSELCMKAFTVAFDATNIPRTIYLSAHSHFDLFKESLLSHNDLNFNVVACDSVLETNDIRFEKGAPRSEMMKIYTLALRSMI